jgi:hypothetical protein
MKTKVNCPVCNEVIRISCRHVVGSYRIYYTSNNWTVVWTGGVLIDNNKHYDGHCVLEINKFVLLSETRINTMLLLK